MSSEEKMKALNDTGYLYNRPLTEKEIDDEYSDMLDDLGLTEDIDNGMDPVEAIKKHLN